MNVLARRGVSPAIKEAVRRILTETLGPYQLRGATVSLTEDADGEPVVLIEARFPSGGPKRPPDGRSVADTLLDARRLLAMEIGRLEDRFPHLRVRFADAAARQRPTRPAA